MLDRFIMLAWMGTATATVTAMSAPELPIPARSVQVSETAAVAMQVQVSNEGTTELRRAADGLFYINGQINNAVVRFVIDTGATTVVLAPADAARAGLSPDVDDYSDAMHTSGGTTAIAWMKADRINVAGHSVRNAQVALPTSNLNVSLLGQSLLSELGPITIDGDRLQIHAAR